MRTIILLFASIVFSCSLAWSAPMVKTPNVSGQFYTANPQELSAQIDQFLSAAQVPQDKKIKLMIVPHAGYPFSGWVAGYGYKAIARNHYSTVILIGPSHFFDFEGASIWAQGSFQTPLGLLPVDEGLAGKILEKNKMFRFDAGVYEKEHSLEVEMPFVQKVMPQVKIVPILMGRPNFKVCQALAEALDEVIGERDDVLVLVSSDMSHYFDSATARDMDAGTIKAIEALDAPFFWNQCLLRKMEMCGFTAVTTALLYAAKKGLNPRVLKYAHSGDVSGDMGRVVGYSSIIFYKDDSVKAASSKESQGVGPLNGEQKKTLLNIARKTIESYVRLGKREVFDINDPRLLALEGAFVTVTKHGQLRGCVGRIVSDQPLAKTVRDMAIAAVSSDPRFNPVAVDELGDIHVEISVLSKPVVIGDVGQIVMGKHGVIVGQGLHQGVFLPQVATETGWSKEQFLSELCSQKAGLKPDAWKDPQTKIEIFTANVFDE